MIGIENPTGAHSSLVTRHSITDSSAPQEVRSFFTLSPYGRFMIVIVVQFTRYGFFLKPFENRGWAARFLAHTQK